MPCFGGVLAFNVKPNQETMEYNLCVQYSSCCTNSGICFTFRRSEFISSRFDLRLLGGKDGNNNWGWPIR